MYGVPGVPMLPPDGQGMSFPMELPKNLFRYGEQTLWSSQLYGAAAVANTTSRLFTTPLGQVGQGFTNALSISETNLKEGGRIPSATAYDVFGLAAQFIQDSATEANNGVYNIPVNTSATSVTNLVNAINNCVVSWDFTQTQVDIAPLHLIGAGGGVFGAEAVTSTAGATIPAGNLNNGNGSVWLYRKHPVALPGNSTFSIVLRWGSRALAVASTPIIIRVVLLGYYKNVIEIG